MAVRDIKSLTGEVVEWISRLIPDSRRDSFNTTIKMQEELSELLLAQYSGQGDIGEECADCLVLLLDIAYLNKIDLQAEFEKKMEANRRRAWDERAGSLRHR